MGTNIINAGSVPGQSTTGSQFSLVINPDGSINLLDYTTNYIQNMDYDANNFLLYLGLAYPGTNASGNGWQIRKMTNNGNGQPTNVTFASGNNLFDKSWANRAGYTYS